jgi:membrane protein required for colicin V production
MNYIDAVIAIPLAWFTYKGFSKGLIIELATLIALLLGIYIAGHFSEYTADLLRENMDFHSKYMGIISFSITFLGVVLLVMLFGKSLEKVVNILLLSFVNKITGALFGFIKVAFVISVIIYIMGTFELEDKLISTELQSKSLLYKPIKSIAPKIFPIITESDVGILDRIDESIHRELE